VRTDDVISESKLSLESSVASVYFWSTGYLFDNSVRIMPRCTQNEWFSLDNVIQFFNS